MSAGFSYPGGEPPKKGESEWVVTYVAESGHGEMAFDDIKDAFHAVGNAQQIKNLLMLRLDGPTGHFILEDKQ